MDNIDENWVIRTDELADLYERGDISIDWFSDDQLMYLIYWNFGVSGVYIMPETKAAEAELIERNNPYNEEYAELISNKAQEFN
jgi:hypothetical protein